MFKVSFKGNFRKIKTFNNKDTIVTLVGSLTYPDRVWGVTHYIIRNWMYTHPSIDVKWENPHVINPLFRLEFSGESSCVKGDTFNKVIGERIAESRAKIKLYKFMTTLCSKLLNDLYVKMYGNGELVRVNENHNEPPKDCIQLAYMKYKTLWSKELKHLNDLLDKV